MLVFSLLPPKAPPRPVPLRSPKSSPKAGAALALSKERDNGTH